MSPILGRGYWRESGKNHDLYGLIRKPNNVMKTILTLTSLLFLTLSSLAQTGFGIKAGAVHTYVSDIDVVDRLGYYAGLTYRNHTEGEEIGFSTELVYLNQMIRVEEVNL